LLEQQLGPNDTRVVLLRQAMAKAEEPVPLPVPPPVEETTAATTVVATPAPTPAATPPPAAGPVATIDHPYVNSLGMKFVPVPAPNGAEYKLLMSVWETRIGDFLAYVASANPPPGWQQEYNKPEYPATRVSLTLARRFATWLTRKEAGALGGWAYRLPTEDEWTAAAGESRFVWGDAWPPPAGSGNFADISCTNSNFTVIPGYNDSHANAAPVGSYAPNKYGLYDMAGNVQELCVGAMGARLRGGSYQCGTAKLLSINTPESRKFPRQEGPASVDGFRLVLSDNADPEGVQSHGGKPGSSSNVTRQSVPDRPRAPQQTDLPKTLFNPNGQ
jgi:hypothetical protein